jgi:magnesium-transporting ATPase (P-type)
MRKTEKKNSLFSMLLVASFVLFVVSQLVINSILTPLGIKLEELNDEKEYLLEENRVISEEIAKNSSLSC